MKRKSERKGKRENKNVCTERECGKEREEDGETRESI